MPSTWTGATLILVLRWPRWSTWTSATPYSTRAPGMLIVLILPPSLEPSTPDVREPREWTMWRLGYRLARPQGGEHRLDRRLVAEPPCVQDHVVVGRVDAVVPVDLPDVGRPVLVRLLQPLPGLLLRGDA